MIQLTVEQSELLKPISPELVRQAVSILNIVFNSPEFKTALEQQSFFSSNRPEFSKDGESISGIDVYNDFINKGIISIQLVVKRTGVLRNVFYGTLGKTDVSGNKIITYRGWLKNMDDKELLISYATHIGHELFHTNYFGYLHDPEYGSTGFSEDKDVTYKIDEILERLIKQHVG